MAVSNVTRASLLNSTNYPVGAANNQKKDSISELWSGYLSSKADAQNSAANVTEITTKVRELFDSHEDANNEFNSKFDDAMDALAKSADKLKTYNFNVEKEGAITNTTSTDDKGVTTTTTTYSKDLQSALDTVKGFVNDYNSAIKLFDDYSSVSKRIERMGTIFGDTTYRAASYESIGLSVGKDGKLSIDESKLANAIVNSPEKVSSILGKDGLASKAEDHIDFANRQKDRLFPTAQKMFGNQLNTAAIYTSKAFVNINALNNMGSFLNMMS